MNTVLRRLGAKGALLGAVMTGTAIFAASVANGQAPSDADPELFAQLMEDGEDLYGNNCAGCHLAEGQGATGPKLAENDFLSSARSTSTQILVGNEARAMPAFAPILDDEEIAAIATYIRNSWGNEFGIVTAETVARYR